MKYRVSHRTHVKYNSIVRLAQFNLRLKPVDWGGQVLTSYALKVTPEPASVSWSAAPYVGNVARLTIAEPLAQLLIDSRFDVSLAVPVPLPPAPTIAELRTLALNVHDMSKFAPSPYLFASPMAPLDPEIAHWAQRLLAPDREITAAALDMAQTIKAQFAYDPAATESDTLAIDAFRARHGVCQDFAHIMIVALRSHGLPAAYVSGYLRTVPPKGKPRLVGADATHAWVNVWCGPVLGWIGFDPTNACITGNDHILTAMGRDYGDVTPVDGVFLGGVGQTLKVAVDVELLEG
jgi:transglutaminase-like putative cysteine protease